MTEQQNLRPIADHLYVRVPSPSAGWGLANCGLLASAAGPAAWIDAPYDRARGEDFLARSLPLLAPGGRIERVIITHGNGDHLWGAEVLPDAEVISTRETLAHIDYDPTPEQMHALVHSGADNRSARYLNKHFGRFDWAGATGVRPSTTFTGELDLMVGEIPVHLIAVGAAHTGGDLVAVLPQQRVVFAGDVIFASTAEEPGDHPIHWAGPLENISRICQDILDTGAQTIVPGHGPVLDRAGVRAYMDYLDHLAHRSGELHRAGLTPGDAARSIIAERRNPELGLPERLLVTLTSQWRHLDGSTTTPPVAQIIDQMAGLAAELENPAGPEHPIVPAPRDGAQWGRQA